MGGRGSTSYSSSSKSLPKGAGELVSTNAGDYAGMSQEAIMEGLSKLDYEVAALFNSRGELIGITTDGKSGEVTASPSVLGSLRYAKDHPEEKGPMTHFHNHPINERTQSIFSSNDIGIYANAAVAHDAGAGGQPVKNVVKTSDGRTYTLEYVGGGRKKLAGFKNAYAYEERKAAARASTSKSKSLSGKISSVDNHLTKWLSSNAASYGFRFSHSKG